MPLFTFKLLWPYFDGLVLERRNSSALAVELRVSCTYPSIWCTGNKEYVKWLTQVFSLKKICLSGNDYNNMSVKERPQWL